MDYFWKYFFRENFKGFGIPKKMGHFNQDVLHHRLQFGGGELGTISSAAIHANKIGDFGYRLSIGHDQNQQRNTDERDGQRE